MELLDSYDEASIYRVKGKVLPLYVPAVRVPEGSLYGKLEPLLRDDDLEDIMYNGPEKPVKVYHRRHGMCDTDLYMDKDEILRILEGIASYAGRVFDSSHPIMDARLPDGSRVNATLPPISIDGPTLTIRKFPKNPFTIVDLMASGTLDPHAAALLWVMVEGLRQRPSNIIIAGGTGAGKTTTLNALASFIPQEERIICIEDTAEIQLHHDHWVRFEALPPTQDPAGVGISMDMLLRNALRMRPTRLIVGEVRGPEAITLFTAMNTGHSGVLSTLHANTSVETITRLTSPPMSVPPPMLGALDLIIMQQRMRLGDGRSVRRITEISEIAGFEAGNPLLNILYKWDPASGLLKDTKVPSRLREKVAKAAGISISEFDRAVTKRRSFLEGLLAKNVRTIADVSRAIQDYYARGEGMGA